MRDKNKGIYQFIIELERKKNRERALREKLLREDFLNRERAFRERLLREDFLGSTEQLPTSQLDSSAIPEELSNKETRPLSERNQQTNEEQESDLRVAEHLEIGDRGIKPFKAGVFDFKLKGYHLETELGISSALAAFSFISIIVLLQIGALINQNLYSYGLQILKGAIPYWIAINTALGMFWLMVTTAILFRMCVLTHKQMIRDA